MEVKLFIVPTNRMQVLKTYLNANHLNPNNNNNKNEMFYSQFRLPSCF